MRTKCREFQRTQRAFAVASATDSKVISLWRGGLGVLILLTTIARVSVAADFTIDPTQTSFTFSGTVTGPNGLASILPQSPGSLTASYTGDMIVDLTKPGSIQFIDATVSGIAQPGPFQPSSLPADYALTTNNFYQGAPSYGAIRASTVKVLSPATALAPDGTFAGNAVNLNLSASQFSVAVAGLGADSGPFNITMTNTSAQTPTLSIVGNQYKLDIPFQGTTNSTIDGYPTVYNLSGTVVAYTPVARANDPFIVNGGFEAEKLGGPHDNVIQGWTVVGANQPNNYAGTQPGFVGMRPLPTQGANEAFINVQNNSAGFYQMTIPPGGLAPNTIYTIKFDLGNRDVTDNGNLPNNDMDPFISLRAFFSLGSDTTDFSKHVGTPYILNQLSTVPEGTYLTDQSFTLDTSTLSPEQLAQGANVVFYATSTTDINRGQVDIDNVRLSIVPEPSSLALAAFGVIALLACSRRRTRRAHVA